MSNHYTGKDEAERSLDHAQSLAEHEIIRRTYSPIGLTFESTDMGEPGERPAVSSVRILTARPGSPIPECAGYELQDYIPNATFVESPGNAPISLGEFTDVYVFVRRSAAALK